MNEKTDIHDMNRLVSVIIPVYNVRPYLEEALDSVLRQTYRNLEILVIDDGSTDGSGEVCDLYAARDPRVRVIHQENRGLSAARNAGLDAMTGGIVAFLDSDDAFLPGMVERMLAALEETGADVASCESGRLPQRAPAAPETARSVALYDRDQVLEKTLTGGLGWAVWRRLYRARVFSDLRFPEGRVYEDTAILPGLLERAGLFCVISDALVLHRVRPGSISQTINGRSVRDYLKATEELADHVLRGAYSEGLKRLAEERLTQALISTWNRLSLLPDSEETAFRREIRATLMARGPILAPRDVSHRLNYLLICRCPNLCARLYRTFKRLTKPWIIPKGKAR